MEMIHIWFGWHRKYQISFQWHHFSNMGCILCTRASKKLIKHWSASGKGSLHPYTEGKVQHLSPIQRFDYPHKYEQKSYVHSS